MKRIIACLVSLVLALGIMIPVNADVRAKVVVTPSATELHRGDTVEISISVKDNTEDVRSFGTIIKYNADKFSFVADSFEWIKSTSEMQMPNFNQEKNTASFVMASTGVLNGDIFKFKLLVKDDAAFGAETVTVTPTMKNGSTKIEVGVEAPELTISCDHAWAATPVDLGDGTHGIKCTKCGEAKDIEAHKGGTATCTKKAECSVCGAEYDDYAAHNYVEKVDDKYLKDAATCTKAAVYYKSCSVCGAKGTETFESGDPIAHNPSTDWESDATGHWKKCQLGCGIKLNGEGGTGVVAHTYTANYDAKYLKDEADCKSDEVYWLSCSVCGFSAKDDTSKPENERITVKENTKKDHEYEEYTPDESATTYKKSDATCQHKATYYKRCKYCKEQGTETFEYGEKAAHDFVTYNPNDSTTVYKASDATCKEAAKYYKKCSVCDKQGAETFSYGSPNPDNHDYTGAVITDLGDGTHGIKCNLCGKAKDVENHEGGTATCIKKAECSKCHAEYGDYAAHKYVEKVDDKYLKTAATCKDKAVYYKSCSVCGEKGTETFEYGDLAPHANIKLVNAKAATEEEEGYTGDEKCLDCDKVITTGHSIAMLVHEPKKVEAKAATAASEGNKEHYYCENCGKYYLDDKFETEVARDDVVIAKLKPAIVDKDKQNFAKGSAGSIGFNSSAAYEDFSGVKVDGKDVDPSNYDVVKNEDGTLRVVFKSAYLETLGAGNHTVSIVSVSGSADTEFTVSAAANVVNESKGTSPKTGDLSNIFFWAVMALAAVFGVFTAVYVRKKVVNR